MGQNANIGQQAAVTVFGNPESFIKLITNHGVLSKIKQAMICPCAADNSGSADFFCKICKGDGYVYRPQRRFLVTDENSRSCGDKIYPFRTPILGVEKVQVVGAESQCGIRDIEVDSFTDTEIILTEEVSDIFKKRVTYYFDGWTYVESDKLTVDADNGLMYTNQNVFDAGYQSSNPLNAYADITRIIKIWNIDTEQEITNYTFDGRTIQTSETIEPDKMYAEYYYADLTQIIAGDIANKNDSEDWTHGLQSGQVKMSLYPFWDVTIGDIIILTGSTLWRNESLTHRGDLDRLFEIEIFELNDVILGSDGTVYNIGVDYILQGRNIKWISDNKPNLDTTISIRYGYKPSYIIFEDNPEPNNLENKAYPKTVLAKSWTKTDKKDITDLIN